MKTQVNTPDSTSQIQLQTFLLIVLCVCHGGQCDKLQQFHGDSYFSVTTFALVETKKDGGQKVVLTFGSQWSIALYGHRPDIHEDDQR